MNNQVERAAKWHYAWCPNCLHNLCSTNAYSRVPTEIICPVCHEGCPRRLTQKYRLLGAVDGEGVYVEGKK